MAVIKETIIVDLRARFKGFARAFDVARDKVNRFKKQTSNFSQVIQANNSKFKGMINNGKAMKTVGGRLGSRFRLMTAGLKGFRMEMLGVLFFGMLLQRFFTGLLKPALNTVGVFELFSQILQILFLPIAMELLDVLLIFLNFVLNLSDGTKLLIGKFVVFGAILGFVLFIIGAFALGIGSVIVAFGGVLGIISNLIPDINILGVNFSSFIKAALGIALVGTAFKLFKGIAEAVFKTLFKLDFIQELFEKFGITIDDTKSVWENFKNIISSGVSSIQTKFGFFGDSTNSIIQLFREVKQKGQEAFEEIKSKIGEVNLSNLQSDFSKIVKSLEEAAPSITQIANAINSVVGFGGRVKDFFTKIKSKLSSQVTFKDAFSGGTRFNDFILRPGSSPVSFNPSDTLIGVKNPNSLGGSGVNIVQNVNIQGNNDEIMRAIQENNVRLVDDLRRQIKT